MFTRRGGWGLRWCFVLALLVSLLVSFPQAAANTNDGAVWAWGINLYGQLGDGTENGSLNPMPIPALSADVVQVSAGHHHSLALLSDGTVWSWGWNNNGQLGQGTTSGNVREPRQVIGTTDAEPFLTNIKAISSGAYFSLALSNDGTVYVWGYGLSGQLGNGGTLSSNRPVQVMDLPTINDVATGWSHVLVLSSDGEVYAWGSNGRGELGLGNTMDQFVPVKLTAFDGIEISKVASGPGSHHSFAITENGVLYDWGSYLDSIGDGSGPPSYDRPTPAIVAGVTDVIDVGAGTLHAIALTASGDVYGWGYRPRTGVVGAGDFVLQPAYVMSDVTAIAIGIEHNLALTTGSTLYAWGSNSYGQLGDGTKTNRLIPTLVPASTTVTFKTFVVGGFHSLAVEQDLTPPTTTATVNNAAPHVDWYQSASVVLTPDDFLATTTYEINGGTTQIYSAPFGLTPDGIYTMTFRSVDPFDNTEADQSLTVKVDGTAPTFGPIDDRTIDAPSTAGVPVSFTVAVSDNLSSAGTITATCVDQDDQTFNSGDTAPVGVTTITCSATDLAGNTGSTSFTVTVNGDTTPPTIEPIDNQVLDALSVLGAPVTFSVVVSDNLTAVDDLVVGCLDQGNQPFISGDTAPVGVTTITCTAKDEFDNTGSVTFTVTVNGEDTPPVFEPIDNQTLNPTSTAGAAAFFDLDVSDNLTASDDLIVACLDQDDQPFTSGQTAPVGITTIICTAQDEFGNIGSVTFTVTVRGVDGAFDILQSQIAELEIPRIMRMSLHAQVRMAERMADADRGSLSCLQLRVLDLTVQILGWVRVVDTQDATDIRDQIHLIRDFLGC